MLEQVFQRADEFDVVHFHVDYLHFPLSRRQSIAARHHAARPARPPGPGAALPASSATCRWCRSPTRSASRCRRRTGAHRAPRAAARTCIGFHRERRRATSRSSAASRRRSASTARSRSRRAVGMPLKIAAKVEPVDAEYFGTVVEPLLDDPLVEFIGEIGRGDKDEFLGKRAALLFPIDWPEPFGLVMIEAMACGTPVIALPHGSVPEVIERRRHRLRRRRASRRRSTAARGSPQLDRAALPRERSRQRFTVERMASDYLRRLRPAGRVRPRSRRRRRRPRRGTSLADEASDRRTEYYILATSAPRRRPDARAQARRHVRRLRPLRRHQRVGLRRARALPRGHALPVALRAARWTAQRPLLLSSTVRTTTRSLAVDLTNPDVWHDGDGRRFRTGTVHLSRSKFLWQAPATSASASATTGRRRSTAALSIEFDADFADIFEVRGTQRERRGRRSADARRRRTACSSPTRGSTARCARTRIAVDPPPTQVAEHGDRASIRLEPRAELACRLAIACVSEDDRNVSPPHAPCPRPHRTTTRPTQAADVLPQARAR